MGSIGRYETREILETFGKWSLRIECLKDLDATIDLLFSDVETGRDTTALERLCPYFGTVWPSARALGQTMIARGRAAWNDKSVLEVGCGLAVPSFVAAKLGAQAVAADFHPDVPLFFERNRSLNSLTREVEYRECDWQDQQVDLGRFDWVIGSDVLYERQHPEFLARNVVRHLKTNGAALIADPGRSYLQPFVDAMKGLGWGAQTDVTDRDIYVLEFRMEHTVSSHR